MDEETRVLLAAAQAGVQRGDWQAAERAAQILLSRNPADPSGQVLIGLARKLQNRTQDACRAFELALAADARRYDAAIELANICQISGRYPDAIGLLDAYAPALSNSPYYLCMAGLAYRRLGLHLKSHGLFEQAHVLQPDIENFKALLAAEKVTLGQVDQAAALYQSLLDTYPRHKRYHFELANLRTAKTFDHVRAMKELLTETDDQTKNIFLHYAIGKELEDLSQWEESFECYRAGAQAAAAASPYRVANDVAMMDSIIKNTSKKWLGRTGVHRQKTAPAPVFVIGLPRTGTTLLDRMLSSHSAIKSIGESYAFVMALQRAVGATPGIVLAPAELRDALALDSLESAAAEYLGFIRHRLVDPCKIFIDKFPENFMYVGWIARAFPDARFILIRRDPMDTCLALYKQVYFRYSYTFDDMAEYVSAFDRLVRHWASLLDGRLMEISYENLVSQPEQELRRLMGHIGMDFEPGMLDFEKNQQPVFTASAVQVREPLHGNSVGKWKRYARQLAPLRTALAARGLIPDR